MSDRTSTFTATPGLYEIKGNRGDIAFQIHCRMDQLEAKLAMTYADSGEAFRNLNDSRQDSFMWSCGMAIQEIQQLWGILTDENLEAENSPVSGLPPPARTDGTPRNAVLGELEAAHAIIRNALAVMTANQKSKWGELNERDRVAGEGVTRANERAHVIAVATEGERI